MTGPGPRVWQWWRPPRPRPPWPPPPRPPPPRPRRPPATTGVSRSSYAVLSYGGAATWPTASGCPLFHALFASAVPGILGRLAQKGRNDSAAGSFPALGHALMQRGDGEPVRAHLGCHQSEWP